ncbi:MULTISPECIES: hypothetical protein [unclassified Coleofasciculus]|uniref:hypothetical protein n=1 Tax=unclassified Coleofasciculus TaxID=2692782 RepID=UPI001880FCDC|nr:MULTISPECIES: hypothetical protein [unclassified Coleofasciculus]MBE9124620.1 hypothetical protein [Coleofasciculus sp. LEGE 07081]MBE9147584.1 hypothetical protein [Coleofasciculus sp. LEGE 07092]
MWHRDAVVSALTLASAMAVNSTALAQNVDIPFTANVPIQVNFGNVVSGIAETTTVGSSTQLPNVIESVTPATVTVQSNTPATLTISPPRLISGSTPDPDETKHITFFSFGSQNVTVDTTDVTVNLPAGISDLELDMRVERPVPFPAGSYDYAVTLTVTP